MIIQTTGSQGILYKIINRRMVESHCDKMFRFNVVNIKQINKQYREAMKQAGVDMQDLDKQDLIIYCEEIAQQQQVQKNQQAPQNNQAPNQQQQAPVNESIDDTEETIEAVKQILMEDQQQAPQAQNQAPQNNQAPNQQQQAPQQNNDQKVQDASPEENKQALQQGQTAQDSKNKQTALKAISGALFLESPEQLESFDVPFQNKNTFFIKLMIRK